MIKIIIKEGIETHYRIVSGKELDTLVGFILKNYSKLIDYIPVEDEYTYEHVIANVLYLYYPESKKIKEEDSNLIVSDTEIYPLELSDDPETREELTNQLELMEKYIKGTEGAKTIKIIKNLSIEKYDDGLDDMFNGIYNDWLPIIDRKEISNVMTNIIKDCGLDNISPKLEDVMAFARTIKPQDVKGIIIGQDPYPYDGNGIAFSKSKDCEFPRSLIPIFKALKESKLMNEEKNINSDISCWCTQGFLLLNTAFTVKKGKPTSHIKIWKEYVDSFFRRLLQYINKSIFVIIWGNEARVRFIETKPIIIDTCKHIVLKWTHPSPLADRRLPENKRFIHCDNFIKVNELSKKQEILPMIWDNMKPILAFCDGACTDNGNKHGKAASATGVYFMGSYLDGTKIQAIVHKCEYKLFNNKYPEMGLVLNEKKEITPTNNRGELLALYIVYLVLIKARFTGKAYIQTDSLYAIKSVTETYKKYKDEGKLSELKNLDLIEILVTTYKRASEICYIIKHKHVRASHNYKLDENCTKLERLYYKGNEISDSLAKEAEEKNILFKVDSKLCVINYLKNDFIHV